MRASCRGWSSLSPGMPFPVEVTVGSASFSVLRGLRKVHVLDFGLQLPPIVLADLAPKITPQPLLATGQQVPRGERFSKLLTHLQQFDLLSS
jgi:hypothetical protein